MSAPGAPRREEIHVSLLTAEAEEGWERFVASRPDAGFYHALAWRDVTREALGHEPRYLVAREGGADGTVCGVLPLFFVRGLFGKRLVSMPMRDRGGLVAADEASGIALLERAAALRDELGCRYLELRGLAPLAPPLEQAVPAGEAWQRHEGWVTHRLDLSPGVDALWGRLNRKALRWSINRARRNGVVVEEDASEEGMRTFHRLFVRTRCSMGIPPFPVELFMAIHRHLVCAGRAQLLIARIDGEPVHGLISFLHRQEAGADGGAQYIPAYAAPQNEHRKLFGNELIFWHSIEWAAQQGFGTYDFGADSVLQEGLHAFKRKWGAEPHPMAYQFLVAGGGAPPDFDSSGPAFRLARAAWQRLPVGIAGPMGAWVTRQLS